MNTQKSISGGGARKNYQSFSIVFSGFRILTFSKIFLDKVKYFEN